jgi:predicted flap endonuclease-1-like 5' DNA nuclease
MTQIFLFLVIAAVIGFVAGWLLRSKFYKQAATDAESVPVAAGIGMINHEKTSTYPIEDVEGVGKAYGQRLRGLGIETTQDLIERGRRAEDRRSIASSISIDEEAILQWTSISDLMRVGGVHSQFSELLEASGVASVQDLAQKDPKTLAATMADVNAREARTHAVPSAETVAHWVDRAKTLPSLIEP